MLARGSTVLTARVVTRKSSNTSYSQFPLGASMAFLVRLFFVGSVFLVFGTGASAQRIVFHVSTGEHANGFHHRGSTWGEYPVQPSYESHGRHYVCASSEPVITYAHGDPDFVPSVYMDYDKALDLGRRILEEQSKPLVPPPLGDVARALRNGSDLPASARSPVSVIQDNRGRLLVCGADGISC